MSGESRTPRIGTHPQASLWRETAFVGLVGLCVLLVMNWPALHAYFFAENFQFVGQYRLHHNDFWLAVLSPIDGSWLRPIDAIVSLASFLIFPLDPAFYHFRNLSLTVINLILLHRILVMLVQSRYARLAAAGLFVISKIHLTTIGYLNVFGSILALSFTLLAVLFLLRFTGHKRWLDYVLSTMAVGLTIFTKESGLVAVVAVAALVVAFGPIRTRQDFFTWLPRLLPLAALVILYFGLRLAIVGSLFPTSPAYVPQLSLSIAGRNALAFSSGISNLAFTDPGRLGVGGLGWWLVHHSVTLQPVANWIDPAVYVSTLVLGAVLAWRARYSWAIVFPVTWMVAAFAFFLTTENLQAYYLYGFVAAAALLVGMGLDRASLALRIASVLTLGLVAINGSVSNASSVYDWQYVARRAEDATRLVVGRVAFQPIDSITFVTVDKIFWRFTLGGSGAASPMLPELLARPALSIRYLPREALGTSAIAADCRNLVLDADADFAEILPMPASACVVGTGR